MSKLLKTRICLKYDSYAEWSKIGGSVRTSAPYDGFIPNAGEVCICTSGTVAPNVDDVLLKVGDGTKNWASLPWVSAKAADVHNWAKLSWSEFAAKIVKGTDINVTVDGTNETLTVSHAVVSRTDGTVAAVSPKLGESFTVVDSVVTSETGHITSVKTKTVNLPSIDTIDHTIVAEGTLIDIDPTVSGTTTTYTVKHEAIASKDDFAKTESISDTGRTFTAITGVKEVDAVGHITQFETTTFTLPEDKNTEYLLQAFDTMSSPEDYGAINLINDDKSQIVKFTGTDSVHVKSSGTEVLISAHDTKYDTTTTASSTDGKLNITQDGSVKTTTTFKGSDAVSVSSNAQGEITFDAHDTKYNVSTAQTGNNVDLFLNDDIDNSESDKVTFVPGANVTLTTADDKITISSSYVDTTYTAGSGLDLTGTVFSHEDTSSVSNLTASERTYVTGLTFDGFGHVTGVTTGSETVVDTDTITEITNNDRSTAGSDETSSDYIVLTDSGSDGNHSYKLYLNTSKVKELVASDVVAAMEFCGATSSLPTSDLEKGDMYKVSGSFTVSVANDAEGKGFTTKIGDSVVYDGSKWYLIPSGDDIEDTWRPISVGTKGSIDTDALNLQASDGVALELAHTSDTTTVTFKHADTSSASSVTETSRTYVSGLTFDDYGHVTAVKTSTETLVNTKDYAKVTGDTGSIEADTVGDTFAINGDGDYITTTAGSDKITVSHNTIHAASGSAVGTSGSAEASVAHGSLVEIPSFNFDTAGHVTSVSKTSFKLPTNTEVTVKENPDSQALIVAKTVGSKDANGNDTVEYNIYHKQYTTASVTGSDDTTIANRTFKALTGLTLEEGHITATKETTFTLPAESNNYGAISISGSSTSTAAVTPGSDVELNASRTGDMFTLAAGNKWLSIKGTEGTDVGDTVTFGHTLSNASGTYNASFTNNKLTVYSTVVDEAGHITSVTPNTFDIAAMDTNTTYTLSSSSERDIDDNTSDVIEGAFDRINITLTGSDNISDNEQIATRGAIRVSASGMMADTGAVKSCVELDTTTELSQTDRKLGIAKVKASKIVQEDEDDILVFYCGNASGWDPNFTV